jgi:surface antigen
VTPTRTDQPDRTYCREFRYSVTIGAEPEQVYAIAWRQPDGTWKIRDPHLPKAWTQLIKN